MFSIIKNGFHGSVKKIKDYKGGLLTLLILSLFLTDYATASNVDKGLSDSGKAGKDLFTLVISGFKWVLAFVPIWFAWFFASKVQEYLQNKEEQGQYEPRVSKNAKVVGAVVFGIITAYLIIGIMAKVFLGMTFADSWSKLIVEPWKAMFGL